MLKKMIHAAANLAVVVLDNLADRIDRAGRQVAIRQMKARKSGIGPVDMKAKKPETPYKSKLKTEPTNAILAKLNTSLAKDLQHRVPTARHS